MTSAASVSVRPPKHFSSTTREARASTSARRVSASSESQEIVRPPGRLELLVFPDHPHHLARPACRVARSRVIDEDAPHVRRHDAEEVRAILPVDARRAEQAQVGLVDEGGRLQGVVVAFAPHVLRRQAAKRRQDEREELGLGLLAPLADLSEQGDDGVVRNV